MVVKMALTRMKNNTFGRSFDMVVYNNDFSRDGVLYGL